MPLVGRDDADLFGTDTAFDEIEEYLLDLDCFGWVQVGSPGDGELLHSADVDEHHGLGLVMPGEISCVRSLAKGDAVLEGSLVEGVGGEYGQLRVHPILDLQPDGSDSEGDESFEERTV